MRALAVAVMLVGCAAPASLPPPTTVAADRVHDDAELPGAAFGALARKPRSIVKQEITIGIRDLVSGRGFSGRGVVLVSPRHALRMILLGPGGTTAMDVWIVDGTFRVAIPALDRVVRGDASTPRSSMRGMPVDLLWRLLVDPFGGLAYARRIDGGFVAWMRRSGGAEIRERTSAGMRAWFFERGKLNGFVRGTEMAVGDAIVPATIDFTSVDPAMEVHVACTAATMVEEVAPAVFADPDAR